MSKYLHDQASARDSIRQRLIGHRAPALTDAPAMPMTSSRPVETTTGLEGLLQQLAANFAPKGVTQTPGEGLRVAPGGVSRASGGDGGYQEEGGGGLSGMLNNLLNAKGEKTIGQKGADVRDRSTTGAAERAQRLRDNTPGPHAKGAAAVQYVQEKIPGLKPAIDTSVPKADEPPRTMAYPSEPAARAYMEEQKPGGPIRMTEKGTALPGDRVLPGKDLTGVDPRVAEIVAAAAEGLPEGYKIRPTSGVRDKGQGQHTKAKATDWEIVKPDGTAIPNEGEDTTGMYTLLAKNAYGYQEKNHPDLTGDFNWGGAHGTGGKPHQLEVPDLMHFDIGGRRGHIKKYSREAIGAEYPPSPKPPGPELPKWDQGLPKVDAKTQWPDPSATTPADQIKMALPPDTGGGTPVAPMLKDGQKGVPPELSRLVMSKEWFVDKPTPDYGQMTIGYGTEARGRTSITEPEARAEMNQRLQQHLDKIDANFPNLPPKVRNSVASLTFNVGEGWMSEKDNGLAAALKAGDMPTAKREFMRYVNVTDKGVKKPLQGLINRRADEARAFDGLDPQYTKNPDAPAGSQPDLGATAHAQPGSPMPADVGKPEAMLRDVATPNKAGTVEVGGAKIPPKSAPPAEVAAEPSAEPAKASAEADVGVAPGEKTPDEVFAEDKPIATEGEPIPGLNDTPPAAQAPAHVAIQPETAVAPAPAAVSAATPVPVTDAPKPAPAAPVVRAAPPSPPRAAAPPLTPAQVAAAQPKPAANPAHRFLDMNTVDFAEHIQKGGGSQVPGMVSGMTVREVVNHPIFGGMAKGQLQQGLDRVGVSRKQFEDAMKEGKPPPPGKQSSAGTSDATDFSARGRTPMAPPGLDKPPEPTPQPTQATSEPEATTPTQAPQGETAPQMTPELARAFENAFKIDMGPLAPPIPPDAQPVLPSSQPGGPGGGLSLAPPGLQNLSALTAPGAGPYQSAFMPGSQGGSIATAGFQPQTGVFSTPLLDQAAAQSGSGGFAASSFSPIAPQFMSWGGMGAGTSGLSGFGGMYGDGGGGAASMFDAGGGSFMTPMTWGG